MPLTKRQARADGAWLRRLSRPRWNAGAGDTIRIADLFCGLGGMSIGVAAAAADLGLRARVALAVERWPVAAEAFRAQFPSTAVRTESVEEIFDAAPGAPVRGPDLALLEQVGPVTILVGGPPCQGHSSSNNHTRGRDPRNALYLRMARAAELLQPSFVLIENVPMVVRDKGRCLPLTAAALRDLDYAVLDEVVDLRAVGVPQTRRRHLLLAVRDEVVDPATIFERAVSDPDPARTVEWAIAGLEDEPARDAFSSASSLSAENRRRIDVLFDRDLDDLPDADRPPCHRRQTHTYKSMYGRLSWNKPAQTVTTGFLSPGQGRYVHPSRRRTLTPHEAARLQTLPDWISAGVVATRSQWAEMIGNAVPPLLARAIASECLKALASRASAEADRRRAPAAAAEPVAVPG